MTVNPVKFGELEGVNLSEVANKIDRFLENSILLLSESA